MTARGFTPRHGTTNLRLFVHLSEEDAARQNSWGRGDGYRGLVTDSQTGQRWHVFGANCGLPNCKCDAVVHEVRD